MNHDEILQKNIKVNDVIKVTVRVFNENITLFGEFKKLYSHSIELNIGTETKNYLFPLNSVIAAEILLKNLDSSFNEKINLNSLNEPNVFVQGQLILKYGDSETYKSQIEFYKKKDNNKSSQITEDCRNIKKTVEDIFRFDLLNRLSNCKLYDQCMILGQKLQNFPKERAFNELEKLLENELGNNLKIINEDKSKIKELIIGFYSINTFLQQIKTLVTPSIEIGKVSVLKKIIENLYIKICKFHSVLILFITEKLKRRQFIKFTENHKVNFFKTVQLMILLSSKISCVIHLSVFSEVSKNIIAEIINDLRDIKLNICFFILASAFIENCNTNNVEILLKFVTLNLYKGFEQNIGNHHKQNVENKYSEVKLPFVISKNIDLKSYLTIFLFAIYESESKSVALTFDNLEFAEQFKNCVHDSYNTGEMLSVDESLNYVINNFEYIYLNTKFLSILLLTNLKEGRIRDVHLYSLELLDLLHEYGRLCIFSKENSYLNFVTFLNRLAVITDTDNKDFQYAESELIKPLDFCNSLIKDQEKDSFTYFINWTYNEINLITHQKIFCNFFYNRYSPEVAVSVLDDCISYDSNNHLLFIPIKITTAQERQIPNFTELEINFATNSNSTIVKLADQNYSNKNEINILEEINVENIEFKGSRNSLLLNLRYNFKSSFNFGTFSHEYTSSSCKRQITFNIPNDVFQEINNVFKNYKNGGVVKDSSMFFGRQYYINDTMQHLTDKDGNVIDGRCICLYGQTRTGKSSLVYHIKEKLLLNKNNIVVDLGDIGAISEFEYGFKYNFLNMLYETIEFDHEDLTEYLEDHDYNLDISMSEFNQNPDLYFNKNMTNLIREISKSELRKKIILIVDEFTYIYDWIRQKKVRSDFMKFWKAMFQNYNISAIIIGQDHTANFINDSRFTNIFNSIKTTEINYLTRDETFNLITIPVSKERVNDSNCEFTRDCLDFLYGITAGSPYILMNICSDFIDYLNKIKCKKATAIHAEDFIQRNISRIEEKLFEPLYCEKMELDSDEAIATNKRLLTEIALGTQNSCSVDIKSLELTECDKKHIKSLQERNIIEVKNNMCNIKVQLYKLWLLFASNKSFQLK